MATVITKTRTNYFAVKDKEAFARLVKQLVTDDGKASMLSNSRGEVGFCADGTIFGINVFVEKDKKPISKEVLEQLKQELFLCGNDDIEEFVGTSIDGWEKDTIDRFLDEVIEQKSDEELAKAVEQYLNPELDEMEAEMIRQIQSLIEPGHACIITDIYYEKLKYLSGTSLIITQDKTETVNLNDAALEMAKKMLGNENYSPDMSY